MASATALEPPRARRGGLVIGGLAAAGLLLAASRLGDPALVPLLVATMATGVAFVLLDYGFTGGFRAYLQEGDGRALGASFVVPAVAALVVLPVGTLVEGYGRFVAPVGTSLLIGAPVFGVGMQLANGCGSGTLVALGQGSRRMMVALPFFALGGVLGTLLLPAALELPALGAVDLAGILGPWGALAATESVLLLLALLVLRGARPQPERLRAGIWIGACAALIFLVSGEPWGITMGLTLWGAKAVTLAGADLSATAFWSDGWASDILHEPVLAMHGSAGDFGLLVGALLAAAATGRLRHSVAIGTGGTLAAALGGLLMGVGARLSFGCNVGAFLGGISSGSLHGFVWFAAVLPGCWLGVRLRPLFRMR